MLCEQSKTLEVKQTLGRTTKDKEKGREGGKEGGREGGRASLPAWHSPGPPESDCIGPRHQSLRP